MFSKIALKIIRNRSFLVNKIPLRFSSLLGDSLKNNNNTSTIPPPAPPPHNDSSNSNKNNNENSKHDNKVKISNGMETIAQENGKFEVKGSEKYKTQNKYVVFSAPNAILPHVKVND
jgi:hypothetical protein